MEVVFSGIRIMILNVLLLTVVSGAIMTVVLSLMLKMIVIDKIFKTQKEGE